MTDDQVRILGVAIGAVTAAVIAGIVSLLVNWGMRRDARDENANARREARDILDKNHRETRELLSLTQSEARNLQSLTQQYQRDLELLKEDLGERRAERDARRDYDYEARKRLYSQYEPLLFQLGEFSETALHRIQSLAKSAKRGDILADGRGWLAGHGYYLRSTTYWLFAPMALFRLMLRVLTNVDLTVDARIRDQYVLAKLLSNTFTDDFEIARIAPALAYDPEEGELHQRQLENPSVFIRQGLYRGWLENAVEALVVEEPTGATRCMRFGEFERDYGESGKDAHKTFHGDFGRFVRNPETDAYAFHEGQAGIFRQFHPARMPVLWRILVIQAHLYEALLLQRRNEKAETDDSIHIPVISHEDRAAYFDWRTNSDQATDQHVIEEPFNVARVYLREHLQRELGPERQVVFDES